MTQDDLHFELDRLTSYAPDAILAEMRRVSDLIPNGPLTRADFDARARTDSATVVKKFGGWHEALKAAGLEHRYSGPVVSRQMRHRAGQRRTDEELLAELRQAAQKSESEFLTIEAFHATSPSVGDRAIRRRFGSWAAALEHAGLKASPLGRTWTDEDYFENLLDVWTHLGRRPKYREMYEAPSRITGGAYEAKWGTWMKAVSAFVERVNADVRQAHSRPTTQDPYREASTKRGTHAKNIRTIPIGLRYKVLKRDRFRCATCGRSPANDLDCHLHVDHIVPLARGGETVEDNLRALCADCNIGKGAS
jgi:5-methylcytosine-specific restriction endonuclease McrA